MKKRKMNKTKKVTTQVSLRKIAKITAFMLLVPLLGNYLVEGWNWSLGDFIFAGVMLFVTCYALEYVSLTIKNPTNKLVAFITIIAAFLILWIELAVGIFN